MGIYRFRKFKLGGAPITYSPGFHYFGEVNGPGDLLFGMEWFGSLSENDRADSIAFTNSVSGNYPSVRAARKALAAAKTHAAAEAEGR